jgi:hypothetical protein
MSAPPNELMVGQCEGSLSDAERMTTFVDKWPCM